MKPVDAKSKKYIESSKEINNKNPKFKIGDIVTISKYENIFEKGYTPNWSEEVLWIKKLKTLFRGHMLLVILKVKNVYERFMKTNCQKQIKKNLELKK